MTKANLMLQRRKNYGIRQCDIGAPCNFEILIFKSALVIKDDVRFAFLFVQTVFEFSNKDSRVMRKPVFAYAKTKAQISCAVLISAFVFAT